MMHADAKHNMLDAKHLCIDNLIDALAWQLQNTASVSEPTIC